MQKNKVFIFIAVLHLGETGSLTKLNAKNGSHDMKQTDSSIIIVRNVCVLTYVPQHPCLFIFSSRGHDRQSSGTKQPKVDQFPQVIGTKQPKVDKFPQQ